MEQTPVDHIDSKRDEFISRQQFNGHALVPIRDWALVADAWFDCEYHRPNDPK